MTSKEKKLYQAMDEIIWNDWDPLRVNDTEEARNEYYGYLPTLFKKLINGTNKKGISNYLNHTTTVNIGTRGHREKDDKVAELLIKKKLEIIGI